MGNENSQSFDDTEKENGDNQAKLERTGSSKKRNDKRSSLPPSSAGDSLRRQTLAPGDGGGGGGGAKRGSMHQATSELKRGSVCPVTASGLEGKRGSIAPVSTGAPRLTSAQITGVRQGWNKTRSKGLSYIGGCIFKSLCNTCPEVNLVFHARHCNVTAQVEQHSKALGELLDLAVKNLEDLSQIDEALLQIGRIHQNFQTDGLTAKQWDKLSESMIEATIMWGLRGSEMQKAWVAIILYLIEKMKLGYTLELRNKRASICPALANSVRRSSLKGSGPGPGTAVPIIEEPEPAVYCQPAVMAEEIKQEMLVCEVRNMPAKASSKRKPKAKA